jgi:hypothetical protein
MSQKSNSRATIRSGTAQQGSAVSAGGWFWNDVLTRKRIRGPSSLPIGLPWTEGMRSANDPSQGALSCPGRTSLASLHLFVISPPSNQSLSDRDDAVEDRQRDNGNDGCRWKPLRSHDELVPKCLLPSQRKNRSIKPGNQSLRATQRLWLPDCATRSSWRQGFRSGLLAECEDAQRSQCR